MRRGPPVMTWPRSSRTCVARAHPLRQAPARQREAGTRRAVAASLRRRPAQAMGISVLLGEALHVAGREETPHSARRIGGSKRGSSRRNWDEEDAILAMSAANSMTPSSTIVPAEVRGACIRPREDRAEGTASPCLLTDPDDGRVGETWSSARRGRTGRAARDRLADTRIWSCRTAPFPAHQRTHQQTTYAQPAAPPARRPRGGAAGGCGGRRRAGNFAWRMLTTKPVQWQAEKSDEALELRQRDNGEFYEEIVIVERNVVLLEAFAESADSSNCVLWRPAPPGRGDQCDTERSRWQHRRERARGLERLRWSNEVSPNGEKKRGPSLGRGQVHELEVCEADRRL